MKTLLRFFLKVVYRIRYFWRVSSSAFAKAFMKAPDIRSTEETIDKLLNSDVSISRFGDGELMLSLKNSLGIRDQKADPALMKRLREVLVSDSKNCIICVSDAFGDMAERSEENKKYWQRHIGEHRFLYYPLLNRKDKVYYNTTATRVYSPLKDKSLAAPRFEKWKKLWEGKDIVFIEGQKTRMGVGNDFFSNARSIRRILGPAENAFDRYDEILQFASTFPKDTLFILALGPAATIMSYDLSQLGYRALDLGHIDVEYEWFLKGSSNVLLKNKYVNEVVGGNKVDDCHDESYLASIIKSFS